MAGESNPIRVNGHTAPDERTRIERFEAAYNRLDRELQRQLDEPREGRRRGFAACVRQIAAERRHFGRHLDFLLEVGELRNALIHNRFGVAEYIAVPTMSTVEKLEAIDEELARPVPLRLLAAREVVTVDAGDRIGRVLTLVREKGYVRFPVKIDGRIAALLTSSGVMRWIASHDIDVCAFPEQPGGTAAGALDAVAPKAESQRIICTIASVSVGEVLARDHRKDEFAIVSRETSADDALSRWTRNPRLEAVIITEHGRADETPIGIATATDLIKLLGKA
ncbi:MAG: CBS domain-containing protein [Phycisphaerales bacterium]